MVDNAADVSIQCHAEERFLSTSEVVYIQCGNLEHPVTNYFHVNVMHSSKEILEEQIRESFYVVSQLHVLLQAKCVFKGGEYVFQKMDLDSNNNWIKITSVEINSKDDWLPILTENLKTAFDIPKGPLWRLLWLPVIHAEGNQEYVLVFMSSHALVDMKACMDLLHKQFLVVLKKLICGKEYKNILQKPIPLAFPSEKIFSKCMNENNYSFGKSPLPLWKIRAAITVQQFLQRVGLTSSKAFMPMEGCKGKTLNNSTSHFPFSFEKTVSKSLIALCKSNSLSVQSILCVLFANAFRKAFKIYSNFNFDGTIKFPTDMRKFNKELSASPMPLGSYTSTSEVKCTEIDVEDNQTFFEYTREVTAEIKKNDISEIEWAPVVNYILKNWGVEAMFVHTSGSATVSNGGNFNYPSTEDDVVTVDEQYFSVKLMKGALFITTLTFNEQMFFCFGYDCGMYSNDFVEFIVDDFKDSVLKIVKL